MRLKKNVLKVLGAAVLPLMLAGIAAAEGPTTSGFVDFGYNYNFNGQTFNLYRGFDSAANTFSVQDAKLGLSGKSDKGVGYEVDVMYGRDAAFTKSVGWNSGLTGNQIDLEQAFFTFECPLTHGTFTVGKFVTMHGAEVIEAKDDFNTSRGLLFNLAIPFTHTGIKYNKNFMSDKLSLGAGVVNGWDNMQDNNKSKSFMAQVGYAPSKMWSATVGGMYGPEQTAVAGLPSVEKNGRSLVDAIFKVMPTDKLTLIANYDWGVEENAPGFIPKDASDKTANWSGIALHAKYALTDAWAIAGRFENFGDEGSRTGVRQTLNSYTATLEHSMNSVISRLEWRGDTSSKKVFVDNNLKPVKNQNTVSIQMIYPF